MTRGRNPKPANVHVLQGTHRADRHGKKDDALASGAKLLTRAPSKMPAAEKAHWRYFVKLLKEVESARTPDEEAMRLLCSLRADYDVACEELELNGHYYAVTTKNGDLMHRASPALAAKRTAETRIYAMLAEFGLTPSGRARLGADLSKGKTNPKDRFFK